MAKREQFKNKKVIIWTANLHSSYCNSCYDPIPANFNSTGYYIKKKYEDRCYSINFTSFSHDKFLNDSEHIYNNKSIEYLLHQLDEPYLYFDFNDVAKSSYLNEYIIMNCNQGLSFNAKWSEITDGVFYIDNMSGLNKLKE